MERDEAPGCVRIGETSPSGLRTALAGAGLVIGLGAISVRVRSQLPEFAEVLHAVYPEFPLAPPDAYADTTVELRPVRGVRRVLRPLATLEIDGIDPFGTFPRPESLPQFEWGVNWAFANMFNAYLLLHAGSLDVHGAGVLLVAQPGSGKSTLTAAMVGRGARLLSDEFGVVRTEDLALLPIVKPIALKNESIGVIRAWSPDAVFGPEFPNTRKGLLTHRAVPRQSVDRRRETVQPRIVVMPRWTSGAPTTISRVEGALAFMELAINSFNYQTLGERGFRAVERLVEGCEFYRLEYGSLEHAVSALLDACRDSVLNA